MGEFFSEKQEFDVIFLDDDELGVIKDIPSRGSRPCVVVEIGSDEDDYAVVAMLSSRDSYDHSKYRLSFGSYLTIDHIETKTITKAQLNFAQLAENKILSDEDVRTVDQYYNNRF